MSHDYIRHSQDFQLLWLCNLQIEFSKWVNHHKNTHFGLLFLLFLLR